MEEITIELDDETADWLESTAAEQKKSASELFGELIRQHREHVVAEERETR
jgi:predicted transcriptional regulator